VFTFIQMFVVFTFIRVRLKRQHPYREFDSAKRHSRTTVLQVRSAFAGWNERPANQCGERFARICRGDTRGREQHEDEFILADVTNEM